MEMKDRRRLVILGEVITRCTNVMRTNIPWSRRKYQAVDVRIG